MRAVSAKELPSGPMPMVVRTTDSEMSRPKSLATRPIAPWKQAP